MTALMTNNNLCAVARDLLSEMERDLGSELDWSCPSRRRNDAHSRATRVQFVSERSGTTDHHRFVCRPCGIRASTSCLVWDA